MTDTPINRRRLLSGGALAAGATMLSAPAVLAQEQIKWRIQSHWTPGVEYYDSVYVEFARWVTEATDGEVQIEALQADTVAPTGEVLGALRRGLLDAAFIFPGYWIGKIPVAGHLNGNLATWDSHEEMQMFFYDMGALDIIREAYAKFGIYQAGPISFAGIALYAKKPIETAEDFKGFKIRSTGTPARVFEKMGAAPVFIPGGELYQSLQTGVVDGAHWGGVSTGWGMNLQEVTDHIIAPDFLSHSNGEFIVGMDQWNKLGDDHKRVIHSAVRAMSTNASAHFRHLDYIRMDEFTNKMGKTVSTVSDDVLAQLRKHSLEVVDEYSKEDPEYSGRVGDLLHEFMRLTGKV
ncbi:TRAP transporter substrate-binding protein [Actibacterium sp. XHP0104]|uniref:TRAP transporter substrate-binding protein n=1 Tax=Actibacterium sp. XHP0104 TaxID=2984335 RepID=UPI0021E99E0A|nr:TRAP transporter substrate-binding protein [Actibacterium sp. XHP0104]MCV2882987.1 TRAP transporter substrate-binding protein [Actibacterium sp. XHP0104]